MSAQLGAERKEAEILMERLKEKSDAAKGSDGDAAALKEQVEKYELAVESAWSDVQRAQAAAEETEARFDRAREFARRTAVEK